MVSSIVNEASMICNNDFTQTFDRLYILPIGQMKAKFGELNMLIKVFNKWKDIIWKDW